MKHEAVVATDALSLDRRGRLLLWAAQVRAYPQPLFLFHNLEYIHPQDFASVAVPHQPVSAFSLALGNPALGIGSQVGQPGSMKAITDRMELTREQLHEFSCDCGGSISNEEMARRIERIAG